jgi:GWxTD domain-containing protein
MQANLLKPLVPELERVKASTAYTARNVLMLVTLLCSVGCSSMSRSKGAQRSTQGAQGRSTTRATLSALDPAETYRNAGFLTASGPVSFIGTARFLAGPPPDSVLAIVAISVPSRSLTFTREGERYRATYEVEFDLLQRTDVVARAVSHFRARETVRVSNLKETTREEESIIFQQIVVIPPGSYRATLTVRDLGSNRSGIAEGPLIAPQFSVSSTMTATRGNTSATSSTSYRLASPVTVHTAMPRTSRTVFPDLVVSPRSAAVFGRDSIVRIYFEWYGTDAVVATNRVPLIRFSVQSQEGQELHTDSAIASTWGADGQFAAAMARVPVTKLGLGRWRIMAWHATGSDTVSAPLFVSPADDLAAVSFEELLGYLRYFTNAARLRTLSDTTSEARAGTWAAFLRATDPSPATPEHEGLREYLSRLAVANARFRGEDVPGWLTDRGMVYSTLGEPDRIIEPRSTGERRARSRVQAWEYAQHRLRLMFVEEEGIQRWNLTPTSEAEFQALADRVRR